MYKKKKNEINYSVMRLFNQEKHSEVFEHHTCLK